MAYGFKTAGTAFIGENALNKAEKNIASFGSRALIVTGKIITKNGMVDQITGMLQKAGTDYSIFNEITGEPDDLMIRAGAEVYVKEGCDFLIGIGGGSPLDSAKAIAIYATDHRDFREYAGRNIIGEYPPVVAIPTTAGTGSEVTRFFCVTDSTTDTKLLLGGDALIPDVAVVDPALTVTSPPSVTAATGMDALTHAVESFTSRKGNPVTDLYARDAIRRIFRYLPIAFRDGADLSARTQMSLAAYEVGICISNASVTLVHGMSRPIGALFHVPHGISNAMLICECLKFARSGCPEKFAELARLIGAASEFDSDASASELFIGALTQLNRTLEIPTLAEYGIDRDEFFEKIPKMAEDALASGSPANTIRQVTRENIIEIYKRLW